MNAKQIREDISIEEVMRFLVYYPVKRQDNRLAYLSPFRNENKPSFYVTEDKNVFFDFGNGYNGSPIDDLTNEIKKSYFYRNYKILQ